MYKATSIRVTGNTSIKCHLFLGAFMRAGTLMNIDRGSATSTAKRIVAMDTAGQSFMPSFPVDVDDPDAAPQERSRIWVTGTITEAFVLVSGYEP